MPLFDAYERMENLTPMCLLYRETKQKTLEEVAAAFGDRVVDQDEDGKRATSVIGETQHVESAGQTAKVV